MSESNPNNPEMWSIISVWHAEAAQDEMDRNVLFIGLFRQRVDAEEAVKGRGYYGGNGKVRERKALEVYVPQRRGDPYQTQVFLIDDRVAVGVQLDQDLPKLKEDLLKAALALLTPYQIELVRASKDDDSPSSP